MLDGSLYNEEGMSWRFELGVSAAQAVVQIGILLSRCLLGIVDFVEFIHFDV